MKNSITASLAILICTLSSQAHSTNANEISGVGSNSDVIISSNTLWNTVRSVTFTVGAWQQIAAWSLPAQMLETQTLLQKNNICLL